MVRAKLIIHLILRSRAPLQLRGQSLNPFQAFYMATLGNARVLHQEAETGNLAPGKMADFLIIDRAASPIQQLKHSAERDLSGILFDLMILGDDEAHFGAESQGGKLKPYRLHLPDGGTAQMDGWVLNPLPRAATAHLRLLLPDGWTAGEAAIELGPREQKAFELQLTPAAAAPCPCTRSDRMLMRVPSALTATSAPRADVMLGSAVARIASSSGSVSLSTRPKLGSVTSRTASSLVPLPLA